jgi:hypothetical protein
MIIALLILGGCFVGVVLIAEFMDELRARRELPKPVRRRRHF